MAFTEAIITFDKNAKKIIDFTPISRPPENKPEEKPEEPQEPEQEVESDNSSI